MSIFVSNIPILLFGPIWTSQIVKYSIHKILQPCLPGWKHLGSHSHPSMIWWVRRGGELAQPILPSCNPGRGAVFPWLRCNRGLGAGLALASFPKPEMTILIIHQPLDNGIVQTCKASCLSLPTAILDKTLSHQSSFFILLILQLRKPPMKAPIEHRQAWREIPMSGKFWKYTMQFFWRVVWIGIYLVESFTKPMNIYASKLSVLNCGEGLWTTKTSYEAGWKFACPWPIAERVSETMALKLIFNQNSSYEHL